jgi:predicted permease
MIATILIVIMLIMLSNFGIFDLTTKVTTNKQYTLTETNSLVYNPQSNEMTTWNFMPAGSFYGGITSTPSIGSRFGSAQTVDTGLSSTDSLGSNVMKWIWYIVAIILVIGIIWFIVKWWQKRKARKAAEEEKPWAS